MEFKLDKEDILWRKKASTDGKKYDANELEVSKEAWEPSCCEWFIKRIRNKGGFGCKVNCFNQWFKNSEDDERTVVTMEVDGWSEVELFSEVGKAGVLHGSRVAVEVAQNNGTIRNWKTELNSKAFDK